MLKWLAENWISLALQLGIVPVMIFIFYGKFWLNKKIRIKRVNPERLDRIGDLAIKEQKISARFFWTKRTFNRDEVIELSGFSTDDFASETGDELINIKFKQGATIIFDAGKEDQMKIVEAFRIQLGLRGIDWYRELIHGTEEEPVLFFKKQH